MATRAATQSENFIVTPSNDGFMLQVWRCAGGTAGDTCTINVTRGRFIKRANGGPTMNNLTTTGNDTQVVFTYLTGGSTSLSFDVELYVQP